MDIVIKDMTDMNEDGLTHNCLFGFNGQEVWLTFPANTVSFNDISSVLYYEYVKDEWISNLENLRDMLPHAGENELNYIYNNKSVWLQQLGQIMSEDELKEYFESYTEEDEDDYSYLDYIDSPEHSEFLELVMGEKNMND